MRRIYVLLGLIAAGALYAPYFGLVWDMNFGAARIGMTHPDGVTQWSQDGPEAYWPDWIPKPDNAHLITAVYYEPAPGHPAGGMARVKPLGSVPAIQTAYAQKLAAEGWEVQQWYQTTSNAGPSLREIRICTVSATRDERSIWLALWEGERHGSRLVWNDSVTPIDNSQSTDGPCT